jgi:RNA polymerase sigma factor (sigma-70 family)
MITFLFCISYKRSKRSPLQRGKKNFYIDGLLNSSMNTNSRISDDEMIRLIRTGDRKGLTTLYETFRSEFVHWAIKFTRCEEDDAFDYYQATVLIVYDNVQAGKISELKSTLKTYLFSVGKNLAWQHKRQKMRNEKMNAEYYLQMHVNEQTDQDPLTDDNNLELISKCYYELGDPCRSLLDLFYFHKKNMEDIAMQLNYKNAETAKNQKYKCMERLRKLVEAELKKQPIE